ncbi:MAG: hypothetical protein N2D54_04945 [Chloroflexota bacterium]
MQNQEIKRPWSVTWLALSVLSWVGIGLTKISTTLTQWDFLNNLPLTVSPTTFLITGGVEAVIGIMVFAGLWNGKPWSKNATKYFAWILLIKYWIGQFVFVSNPLSKENWLYSLFLSGMIIFTIYLILSRLKARKFFGEIYERER